MGARVRFCMLESDLGPRARSIHTEVHRAHSTHARVLDRLDETYPANQVTTHAPGEAGLQDCKVFVPDTAAPPRGTTPHGLRVAEQLDIGSMRAWPENAPSRTNAAHGGPWPHRRHQAAPARAHAGCAVHQTCDRRRASEKNRAWAEHQLSDSRHALRGEHVA